MGTTNFRGNFSIGDVSITEAIEDNLISYIDWCFLQMGAFFNVEIPSSGAYGGNLNTLRPVDDPRYTDGQIWESYRQNWVWESGLQTSTQPINISGVFINNTFLPRGSGYSIDYKHGQLIFDTPRSITSNVKLAYSHKWINVVGASEVPWFRTGQTRSFRVDDSNFSVGSVWSLTNNISIDFNIFERSEIKPITITSALSILILPTFIQSALFQYILKRTVSVISVSLYPFPPHKGQLPKLKGAGPPCLYTLVDGDDVIFDETVAISGIFDANIVQVSGIYVSYDSGIVDANVVQVSGVYVDLSDFNTGSGTVDLTGIVQANVVQISGVPVGIDSGSVADS